MKAHQRSTPPPPRNKIVIVSFVAVFFFLAFITLFIRDGYPQKIIRHFSNSSAETIEDKTLIAWKTCLKQLNIKTDIVFFGDSITRQSDFTHFFPNKTICNLGLGSDPLSGMLSRVDMIESVSPDQIFLMGGINSLSDKTLNQSINEYDALLSGIKSNCEGELYVISTLPVSLSVSKENRCSPETIRSFNASIQSLSEKYGIPFIDIYSQLCTSDGYILPEMTTDGVHLTETAYTLLYHSIRDFIE